MKFRVLMMVLLGLAMFSTGAFGQAIGSITGVVQDATQARIPGVSVTATNIATGIKTATITNEAGAYNFSNLAVGPYSLEAALPGFRNARVSNIDLRSNETLRYNLTLEVAGVGTEIEVTLDARDVLAISSASVGEALSGTQVTELPLVGGDVLDLINVLPGFRAGNSFPGGNADTFAGIASTSINTVRDGLSVSDGRFVNGVFGTTVINPDMVSEIRLVLTPVDAEMGRGNGQVQITTRSGTNRFNGSAVWNIRNTAMDANTWGNNNDIDPETGLWSPTTPNWENHHQITGSYGGPIIRNKTFFFALFDRNFVRTRAIVNGLVLTDTARQGIFRYFDSWTPDDADGVPGTSSRAAVDFQGNPLTREQDPLLYRASGLRCFSVFGTRKVNPDTFQMSPFTAADCQGGTPIFPRNNATYWDAGRPAADTSGFMQSFLAAMPRANNFQGGDGLNTSNHRWTRTQVNGGVNSAAAYGGESNIERKQFNLKLDHNFNQNHKANFGYTIERDWQGTNFSNWPNQAHGLTRRAPWVITSSFTSTLSPAMINEARFGVRKNILNELDPWENPNSEIAEQAKTWLLATPSGIPAAFNNPGGLLGTANSPYNNGDYNGNRTPLYSFADTLSWTRGTHAFRFGSEVRLTKSVGYNGIPARPTPILTGGAGANTASTISSAAGGITGLVGTGAGNAQTTARNMLYFFSGSINSGSQLYWIDDSSDVANGNWENLTTVGRKYRDQILNEVSLFVKDDWKITPSLTLNLGLRWEWYGVPYIGSGFTTTVPGQGLGLFGVGRTGLGNANLFDTWLRPGGTDVYLQGYGPSGLLQCTTGQASGVAGIPASNCDPNLITTVEFVGPNSPNPGKSVYRNDMNNFGPAIGFAWQLPFGRPGQTTMRGGYQVTYGGSGRNGIASDGYLGGAPGATSNASIDFVTLGNPYLTLNDVPSLVPLQPINPRLPGGTLGGPHSRAGNFTAFDPNYTTPYVQNFTLSLTHQLNRTMTVDLRYAGTQGKKQNGSVNLNTSNVWKNKELFDALEAVRRGAEAPLLDQMLAGVNLNSTTSGYAAIGTSNTAGVLQTAALHLRRRFPVDLSEGDYVTIANFFNSNTGGSPTSGLQAVNSQVGNIGGRILRNGCNRLAAGAAIGGAPAGQVRTSSGLLPIRCFPENYLVANPQFANPTFNTNTGSSNYHSMQAQFNLRPTFGVNLQTTYTWSKALELPGTNWTDPLDRDSDYRVTTNHVAHDFRTNGTFQLPFGPNKLILGNSSGPLARAIEGWQMSWTYNAFTGSPQTISAQNTLYNNGTPDVVGPWDLKGGEVLWGQDVGGQNLGGTFFGPAGTYDVVPDPVCAQGGMMDYTDAMGFNLRTNGSCLLTAVADSGGRIVLRNANPGTRGTLGQRTITGRGAWSLDGSLSKTFRVDETRQLQVRFDANNVLNHPLPNNAVFNINSADFGEIGAKGNQVRRFQAQLRLLF